MAALPGDAGRGVQSGGGPEVPCLVRAGASGAGVLHGHALPEVEGGEGRGPPGAGG